MPMRTLVVALASLVALAPIVARAQADAEAAAPLEDRPAPKYDEVERGFFFTVESGGLFLVSPKGSGGFSPGRTAGVTIGTDFGERFAIGVLVLGTHTDTPAEYRGPKVNPDTGRGLRGDFSSLILGAVAKFAFFAKADDNNVTRFFAYARGGGGMGLMGPAGMFEGADAVVLGGVGVEMFTHLRHFSLGIDVDALFGVTNMGFGFIVAPHLRYTF